MNPIEWLVYAAAWKLFSGPWAYLTKDELFAAAEVLTIGDRHV